MTEEDLFRATRSLLVISFALMISWLGMIIASVVTGTLMIDATVALSPCASLAVGSVSLYRPAWFPSWLRIQCEDLDENEAIVRWRSRTFVILFLPLSIGFLAMAYVASIGSFAGTRGSGPATVGALLLGVILLALATGRSTTIIAEDRIEINAWIAGFVTRASFHPVCRAQIEIAVKGFGSSSQPGIAIAADGRVQRYLLNAPIQDKPRGRWQFADLPIITSTGRRTTLSELIMDRLVA